MPHRFPGAWKEIEELKAENAQLKAKIAELEASNAAWSQRWREATDRVISLERLLEGSTED